MKKIRVKGKSYIPTEDLEQQDVNAKFVSEVWYRKYSQGRYSKSDLSSIVGEKLSEVENRYPNPTSDEDISRLISNFKYLFPGGSVLYGLGSKKPVSISNCFVINGPEDSYGGIFRADQEMAQIMKRRGGVGMDLSRIRPTGSHINNSAGTSTGVVSFANRYSNTTGEVAQDGRRGALMISLDGYHSDLVGFVKAKLNQEKINNANISVKLNSKIILSNNNANKNLVKQIAESMYESAEPGILFWDKIISESPADCYASEGFETVSTNPCTTGDTKILTDRGNIEIKNLINKPTRVWNGKGFSKVTPFITGKTNVWLNIEFSDGSTIKCTPYHNFYLHGNNDPVEASELMIGNKLQKYTFPLIDVYGSKNNSLYTHGFFCGDGFYKRTNSAIDLYHNKQLLIDYLDFKYKGKQSKDGKKTRIYLDGDYKKDFVPDTNYSVKSRLSFLAGIIDSDGTINDKGGSINISSINKQFLVDIKYMLSTLGAASTINLMKKACIKKMPDGHGRLKEYNCKDCYRIVISATNVKKLMGIGLKTFRVKLYANPQRDASRFIKVVSIKEEVVNNEPTYCFNEPLEHKGVFNGVLTGQCGELPLSAYSSCLLLHLNLYHYIDKPFTKNAEFKFEQFAKDVMIAQRMADNLVDIELQKINSILEKVKSDNEPEEVKAVELNLWNKIYRQLELSRRTGLGWLGLADALAALNIKYDSDEAIQFAGDIQFEVAVNSYKSSIILAKERGAFPVFNHSKEFDHIFVNKILNAIDDDKEFDGYYAKHGRRNLATMTIAPTGSLSIISQVSGGIEPVFELKYNRIFKNGFREEEYEVFHKPFKSWYDINKKELPFNEKPINELTDKEFNELRKLSPYAGSTAYEINPMQKIKLQAAVQKYNDHAVSVTHNVKSDTSVKTIISMIKLASELGCKGFTLYRDGSRNPILSRISNEKKDEKESIISNNAFKRPETLEADVYISTIAGEKYAVALGLVKNKPYEVFTFKPTADEIKSIKAYDKFHIYRTGNKSYSLSMSKRDKDGHIISILDIDGFNKRDDNGDNEAICRLLSISMRHGVDITYLYEQLIKPNTNINNTYKVLARIFKKYLDNEKLNRKTELCPNCEKGVLVFEEGCVKCNRCGYSRC